MSSGSSSHTEPQQQQQEQSSNNNNNNDIRVLGVCGGIGSGKSMACQLLVSELGCLSHIEADSIAHSVYQPGSQAIYDVVDKFGPDVLLPDKPKGAEEIDRKKLGGIVFGDPSAMSSLERIVWPHVKAEILSRIEEIKKQLAAGAQQQAPEQQNNTNNNGGDDDDDGNKDATTNQKLHPPRQPIVVLEAAVLLDAGWDDLLDAVWVVRAPREIAVERLVEYRSFTAQEAEQRITAQTSRRGIDNLDEEVQKGVVTAVIENTGGVDELKKSLLETLNDSNAWKKKKHS